MVVTFRKKEGTEIKMWELSAYVVTAMRLDKMIQEERGGST